MPGSSFVLAKSDDASDLRHWKELSGKKSKQSSLSSDDDNDADHTSGDRDESNDDTEDDYDVHRRADTEEVGDVGAARSDKKSSGSDNAGGKSAAAFGYPPRRFRPYPPVSPPYPPYGPPMMPPPGVASIPPRESGEEEATDTDDTTSTDSVGPQLFAHPQVGIHSFIYSLTLSHRAHMRIYQWV
jgi:hypothetical protein